MNESCNRPEFFSEADDCERSMKMSFCQKCGAKLLEGAKFCTSCGNRIEVIPAVVTEAAEALNETAAPVYTAAAEVLTEAADNVAAIAEENISEAADSVTETIETAQEAAENVTEVAEAAVAETVSEVKETASEAVESVAEVPAEVIADVQPEIPAAPVYTEPIQPAAPVYTEPVQPTAPVYTQPVQPAAPVYTQPIQPVAPVYSEPVYQQPVQQPAQKPAKKKKLGFGRRTLAFFLCIPLLLLGILGILYFSLKSDLTEDHIREVMSESESIGDVEIGRFIGGKTDEDTTLVDFIYDQIPSEQIRLYPELTKKNLKLILENKEVQKILSGTLDDVFGYFLGESEDLEIDSDRVIDAIKENKDLIEKYTGKELVKEDYDEIRRNIEDFNENELADIAEDADEDFETVLKITRFVFSDTGKYIVIGVLAFFAILVILACGTFFDVALMHLGFTGALAGGGLFCLCKFGMDKIIDIVDEDAGEVIEFFRPILIDDIQRNGLIVLCAGGACIVIAVIWKVVRHCVKKD